MKKKKKRQSRKRKIGAIPGSLLHVGIQHKDKVELEVIDFTEESFEERLVQDAHEFKPYATSDSVSWVNMTGIHDSEQVEKMGEIFELDELILEDLMNAEHRPKLEEYTKHSFFVLKMLSMDENHRVDSEQVALILGENYVLSFQERRGDVFESIRDRIRKSLGRVRKQKSDYLAFLLIDIIIDNYFYVIENLGDQIDELEEEVIRDPKEEILVSLQTFKHELNTVRKAVYPLREMLSTVLKEECGNVSQMCLKYYRDSYDHCLEVLDAIESFTDLSNSVRDLYISSVSNKMNQIMKVLTIMASIFIPLTFIAGIYGMNFSYIPEIHGMENGYFIIWGVMILVTLMMIVFFKRKKWF